MAAQQFSFGPVYCETLSAVPGSIPVEPLNTSSNGVIVLFGLAGLYFVIKRAPKAVDLYLLSALLVTTGIGSGIWHGLRDGDALFWEVRSGLFFLFAFVFCWARRLWSYWGALPALLAFNYGYDQSQNISVLGISGRWVAITPLVVASGTLMVVQTYYRSRQAALLGAIAIALAIIAVILRTLDLAVCDTIPFGTHFLWHSFLSAGGFAGILSLIALPARPRNWLAPNRAVRASVAD
jgi:membrane protein CcdC involved in cytochrome C biogenesis